MLDDCANHGVPDVQVDDALVGQTHLLRVAFDLLSPLRRDFHPELHLPLLAVLFERDAVVVLGIAFYGDGGGVELFSPEFLYLLDLVLEVLVLVLREHVLELVVEVLLTVLQVYFEGVAIERISVGVGQFLGLEHAVLGLLVGLDDP